MTHVKINKLIIKIASRSILAWHLTVPMTVNPMAVNAENLVLQRSYATCTVLSTPDSSENCTDNVKMEFTQHSLIQEMHKSWF